jgi:hypothetical protein
LIEAALREKLRAQAVHLFQQDFAGVIDEADTAEVDAELWARSGGGKFTPALLQRSHAGPGEGTFDAEEEFSPLVFGSDS